MTEMIKRLIDNCSLESLRHFFREHSATNTYRACRAILCVTLLGTICGCGGGGGSSGGSGKEQGSDSIYGVRVLHASIDGAPVDVISSGQNSAVLSQAFFAGAKGYRPIPSGEQILSLTKSGNQADSVATFNITATSRDRYSIFLFGDNQTFGLRTRLIEDSVPAEISGSAIRIANGITGAAALSINISGVLSEGTPEQLGFGQNTDYLVVGDSTVSIQARRAVDGASATSISFAVEPGKAYTVLLAGELGFYTKAVVFRDN